MGGDWGYSTSSSSSSSSSWSGTGTYSASYSTYADGIRSGRRYSEPLLFGSSVGGLLGFLASPFNIAFRGRGRRRNEQYIRTHRVIPSWMIGDRAEYERLLGEGKTITGFTDRFKKEPTDWFSRGIANTQRILDYWGWKSSKTIENAITPFTGKGFLGGATTGAVQAFNPFGMAQVIGHAPTIGAYAYKHPAKAAMIGADMFNPIGKSPYEAGAAVANIGLLALGGRSLIKAGGGRLLSTGGRVAEKGASEVAKGAERAYLSGASEVIIRNSKPPKPPSPSEWLSRVVGRTRLGRTREVERFSPHRIPPKPTKGMKPMSTKFIPTARGAREIARAAEREAFTGKLEQVMGRIRPFETSRAPSDMLTGAYRPFVRKAMRREPTMGEPLLTWHLERMFGAKPFRASPAPSDLLKTDFSTLVRKVWGGGRGEKPTIRLVSRRTPRWKLKALEREARRKEQVRSGTAKEVRTKSGLIQLVKVKQKEKVKPTIKAASVKPEDVLKQSKKKQKALFWMPQPTLTTSSIIGEKSKTGRKSRTEQKKAKGRVSIAPSIMATIGIGGAIKQRHRRSVAPATTLPPAITEAVREGAKGRKRMRTGWAVGIAFKPIEGIGVGRPSIFSQRKPLLPPLFPPLPKKHRGKKKGKRRKGKHKEPKVVPFWLASYENVEEVEMATGEKAHHYVGEGNFNLALNMKLTGEGIPTLEQLMSKSRKRRKR